MELEPEVAIDTVGDTGVGDTAVLDTAEEVAVADTLHRLPETLLGQLLGSSHSGQHKRLGKKNTTVTIGLLFWFPLNLPPDKI